MALGVFSGWRGRRKTMKRMIWEWELRAELGPSLLPSVFFDEEEEGSGRVSVQRNREAEWKEIRSQLCLKEQSWKSQSPAPESKAVCFQDTGSYKAGSWELCGVSALAPWRLKPRDPPSSTPPVPTPAWVGAPSRAATQLPAQTQLDSRLVKACIDLFTSQWREPERI